jgi:hypothetical protein
VSLTSVTSDAPPSIGPAPSIQRAGRSSSACPKEETLLGGRGLLLFLALLLLEPKSRCASEEGIGALH